MAASSRLARNQPKPALCRQISGAREREKAENLGAARERKRTRTETESEGGLSSAMRLDLADQRAFVAVGRPRWWPEQSARDALGPPTRTTTESPVRRSSARFLRSPRSCCLSAFEAQRTRRPATVRQIANRQFWNIEDCGSRRPQQRPLCQRPLAQTELEWSRSGLLNSNWPHCDRPAGIGLEFGN